MEQANHELILRIYDAVTRTEGWQQVTDGLSELFGGSIVALGLLSDPRDPRPSPGPTRFATGMEADRLPELFPYLIDETPWTNRSFARHRNAFSSLADGFQDVSLEDLRLYEEWMKPQGMAPIWPCVNAMVSDEGQTLGGVTVFRRCDQGPFSAAELERATRLVPHLRRAAIVHRRLHAEVQERLALGEAIDRLYTGVLLLDRERRVVIQNRAAGQMLAEDDGLRVDRSGPSAHDAQDNVKLQKLIARAIADGAGPPGVTNVMRVRRPSGRQDYTLTVGALIDTPAEPAAHHAAVVIFLVDPEADLSAPAEVLEDLYDLTHSEAQIVRLIAEGCTLEEAARRRGVRVNTARSHLKHAFAKTGTTRQSELLRLIVAGVGSMGSEGS